MIELEFDPQIGEEVIGPGAQSDDRYEILDRTTSLLGETLLKVRRLSDGALFDRVPHILFRYPLKMQVRRAVSKILSQTNHLPQDLQEGRFEVVSDEMYDGTPKTVVYFYLKPDAASLPERVRARNDFYRRLQAEINPLLESGRDASWLQFVTREARSALSAAS